MANGGKSDPLPTEDKQKRILQSQNAGHFSMIRALHLADVITLGNGFCGIMSIFSSLRYCLDLSSNSSLNTISPPPKTNLWLALSFMPFGLFFDFLDGRVARWRGKSSLMGAQLDSLADLISFGVSPACAAFALGIRTPLDHVLLTFFALCGLARLARFNVTTDDVPHDASGKAKYFEGTPIPSSLGIAAWMAVWVYNGWLGDAVPFGVAGKGLSWEFHPVVLVFVAHGCAMVSKSLHVPKP
ncbi:CDP-diacylglycerol--serine O-phosphatidyltransferase [Elsinoe australis]|uniref:CDP-diacylglycerol--serine O-phosphatidyltransferase n=1 Tax=Elsinoe australis TaxID=40998 RepID=A0A4U7B786_9PEZI|nr:CDP-diacylglycerol--serine O-phosphatidyltransferase [Elsinoe australis]